MAKEFYYAVGFRWNEDEGEDSKLGFYMFGNGEIHHGTKESAIKFRDFCAKQPGAKHTYRIYKVKEMAGSESK